MWGSFPGRCRSIYTSMATPNENGVFKRFSVEFWPLHYTCCPIRTTCVCYIPERTTTVGIDSVSNWESLCAPVHVWEPTKEKLWKRNFTSTFDGEKKRRFERRTTKRHPINAIRILRTKAGNKFVCAKAKNESCQPPPSPPVPRHRVSDVAIDMTKRFRHVHSAPKKVR